MTVPGELRASVERRQWYHTLELGPGLTTPGWFDLRGVPAQLPIPLDLSGKRCLDVGTFDGFWAFELERRGAAEVVAIDVLDPHKWDWPAGSSDEVLAAIGERKGRGDNFLLAHEALGSRVQRHELSVYDLATAGLGEFDFVYVGSLLLHLRDPVRAISAVCSVARGQALFVDAISLSLTLRHSRQPIAQLDGVGRPWWWKPNLAGLTRMVESGGFRVVGRPRRFYLPAGAGYDRPPLRPQSLRHAAGRVAVFHTRVGDPHGVVLGEPRPGVRPEAR